MLRLFAFLYGLVAYVAFLAVMAYMVVFLGFYVMPEKYHEQIYAAMHWAADSESGGRWNDAFFINLALLAAFAIPHSVMARPAFKKVWTKIIPRHIERSTYVLVSSALLALLFWQWRSIPELVWGYDERIQPSLFGLTMNVKPVFQTFYWIGWALVFGSTFMIDHWDLVGLRQTFSYLRGREYTPPAFKTPGLYRFVRHPIMLGFLIVFWSTPTMTLGHLMFSAGMSIYTFIGIRLEERSLVGYYGDSYRDYQRRTSMLLPLRWRR